MAVTTSHTQLMHLQTTVGLQCCLATSLTVLMVLQVEILL